MKKLILFLATLLFAINFPALTGRVVDNANILSPQTEKILTQKLKAFEQNTSNQIVVVTLKSLQGHSIEDYGYKLGRHWGIGQKGKDNGVLLIVAPNERKVRIEVGYGLEGTLTDAKSFLIINDIIIPYFKKGDFDKGILKGTEAIMETIKGTFKADNKKNEDDFSLYYFLAIFFVTLFGRFIPFVKNNLRAVILPLFIGFFVYVITKSLLLAIIATIILIIIFSFRKKPTSNIQNTSYHSTYPGNFDFETHGDFSNINIGDGFSGGGGGFGGGGASGSW